VTLAVDATGAVTRCELRDHAVPSNAARVKCYSSALQGARFPAGGADRRVALQVFEHPTEGGVKANGKRYYAGAWPRPSSGTVVNTEDANLALSQCSLAANAPLRFRAWVDVDGTGKAIGASAEGEPKSARDCVVGALQKIRASCTKDGARLRIPFLTYGSIE
jgi:hypothetical protein